MGIVWCTGAVLGRLRARAWAGHVRGLRAAGWPCVGARVAFRIFCIFCIFPGVTAVSVSVSASASASATSPACRQRVALTL